MSTIQSLQDPKPYFEQHMKILFVCQYFYPEIFRGNDIAFDWAARGENVTVITAVPNYPSGKFFDGYGLFRRRNELVRGVQVIRVPVVPRGKGGPIRLMLNYFSFVITASVYCFYLAFVQKFDFVFVQQLSPVTMALPALIVKKLQRIPLYIWILDLWPESLSAAGGIKNKYILIFFKFIVRTIYNNSSKLLISSKGFSKSISKQGNYTNKIIYFPNWAEEVFESTASPDKNINLPPLPDGFLIMFAGNIGEAQDFDNIMKAALLLKSNQFIKFIIIGDGRKKEWLGSFIKINHLEDTVFIMGRYPIDFMPAFFKKANAVLLPLKNDIIFNLTAPAKLQAYMASEKPIIAMLSGDGADIINEANCGLAAPAGDFLDLVNKIKIMSNYTPSQLDSLGKNGKKYCLEYFNKHKSLDYLFELMKAAIVQ